MGRGGIYKQLTTLGFNGHVTGADRSRALFDRSRALFDRIKNAGRANKGKSDPNPNLAL